MTEFERQVAEALSSVPHSDDCASKPDSDVEGMFVAKGVLTLAQIRRLVCTCDRADWLAARVAAAIEAARLATVQDCVEAEFGRATIPDWTLRPAVSHEAALAALRGAS
jgi:hypothetical protein